MMIDTHAPTLWIVGAVGWVFLALVAGGIATGRNRDGAIWMTVAMLLGPLVILPLLIFEKPGES